MKFVKNFTEDFDLIVENIKQKNKFAFSKYADGERFILNNLPITNIDNWTFSPNKNIIFHKNALDSILYKHEGYHIGISCPCCDKVSYNWYLNNKGSDDSNTTFANIFVNNNYQKFKTTLLPLFNTYKNVFLIANKSSNLNELKNILKIDHFFGIGNEAFNTDLNLPNEIISFIENKNIKDSVFLFCAGSLGNILSHKLWDNNKLNTYIDIGSTLNPWFGMNIRDYQKNSFYTNKICEF